MAKVPRHVFVEEALASRAYEDTALPLGMGQTISQPFIVARMIELLLNGRKTIGKTLEIGAGCGYQAAVLAQLSSEVYAIERLGPLLEKAKSHMRRRVRRSPRHFLNNFRWVVDWSCQSVQLSSIFASLNIPLKASSRLVLMQCDLSLFWLECNDSFVFNCCLNAIAYGLYVTSAGASG